MIEWEIIYTADREKFQSATVVAPTYTMAILRFVIDYPNMEYVDARRCE